MQQQVKDAQNILVVGGGAVGVEFAGEVVAAYPNKKITLVHSGTRLIGLDFAQKLHDSLLREMKKLGITVILGDRVTGLEKVSTGALASSRTFTTTSGKSIQADFVIKATGNTPNSQLISTLSPILVSPSTKRMLVTPELKIADAAYPNIYAFGDASESEGTKVSFGELTAFLPNLAMTDLFVVDSCTATSWDRGQQHYAIDCGKYELEELEGLTVDSDLCSPWSEGRSWTNWLVHRWWVCSVESEGQGPFYQPVPISVYSQGVI